MDEWTTEWPQEEGWFWTKQEGYYSGEIIAVRVRHAGQSDRKFWVWIRNGGFLHKEEQKNTPPIWWIKAQMPKEMPSI
jgi:hypothetical protein